MFAATTTTTTTLGGGETVATGIPARRARCGRGREGGAWLAKRAAGLGVIVRVPHTVPGRHRVHKNTSTLVEVDRAQGVVDIVLTHKTPKHVSEPHGYAVLGPVLVDTVVLLFPTLLREDHVGVGRIPAARVHRFNHGRPLFVVGVSRTTDEGVPVDDRVPVVPQEVGRWGKSVHPTVMHGMRTDLDHHAQFVRVLHHVMTSGHSKARVSTDIIAAIRFPPAHP